MEIGKIRNFCIIAHIDHGKSTLADILLGANIAERAPPNTLIRHLSHGLYIPLELYRAPSNRTVVIYRMCVYECYRYGMIDCRNHAKQCLQRLKGVKSCYSV